MFALLQLTIAFSLGVVGAVIPFCQLLMDVTPGLICSGVIPNATPIDLSIMEKGNLAIVIGDGFALGRF